MLRECANPSCCTRFRYLHEGKLFEVETQFLEHGHRQSEVQRYWLCDRCARSVTLGFRPHRGLVALATDGKSETTIQPSSLWENENIARVLVRPFDPFSWTKVEPHTRS